MSSVSEASVLLRQLAEPRLGGDLAKVAIDRAAKRAGLSYWRAFDIWYGKARRLEPYEADAITDALAEKNREDVRNELHDLRLRLARMEARLATQDPDFHRVSIDALREGAGLGGRRSASGGGMGGASGAKA